MVHSEIDVLLLPCHSGCFGAVIDNECANPEDDKNEFAFTNKVGGMITKIVILSLGPYNLITPK